MPSPPAVRILTTCRDLDLVQRAASALPYATSVARVGADSIRRLDGAECLIVDAADDARNARATGFDGAIIVLAAPRTSEDAAVFLAQGTLFAAPTDAAAVTAALVDAVPLASDGTPAGIDPVTSRTRRLIATGELAVALRHAINNPLTALMAEIQLLQLEAHDDDTRAAAGRMLELVRRLTEMSRSLESVRDR